MNQLLLFNPSHCLNFADDTFRRVFLPNRSDSTSMAPYTAFKRHPVLDSAPEWKTFPEPGIDANCYPLRFSMRESAY